MEYINSDLTEKIIRLLFEVYNSLGYGLREKFYERAIMEEANRNGIVCSHQVSFPVEYKGNIIGYEIGRAHV